MPNITLIDQDTLELAKLVASAEGITVEEALLDQEDLFGHGEDEADGFGLNLEDYLAWTNEANAEAVKSYEEELARMESN